MFKQIQIYWLAHAKPRFKENNAGNGKNTAEKDKIAHDLRIKSN
jgi:hypothetical protein